VVTPRLAFGPHCRAFQRAMRRLAQRNEAWQDVTQPSAPGGNNMLQPSAQCCNSRSATSCSPSVAWLASGPSSGCNSTAGLQHGISVRGSGAGRDGAHVCAAL
jgi:hypothetical protein